MNERRRCTIVNFTKRTTDDDWKQNFLRHTKFPFACRSSCRTFSTRSEKSPKQTQLHRKHPSPLHVVVRLPCGNSIFRSRFIAKILERDIKCDSRRKRFGTVCSRHESLMGEVRAEFLRDVVSEFRYPNILEISGKILDDKENTFMRTCIGDSIKIRSLSIFTKFLPTRLFISRPDNL